MRNIVRTLTDKNIMILFIIMHFWVIKEYSTPIRGHAGPEGSRKVKAPRFLDIGTIWW
jgi:hypothetical protein